MSYFPPEMSKPCDSGKTPEGATDTTMVGLAPGDVVALKSGSAQMTVLLVNGTSAKVIYSPFETKVLQHAEIPLVALRKIR